MKQEIIDFIERHHIAVLSTIEENTLPNGDPIYFYFHTNDQCFYFASRDGIQKVINLEQHPIANLTIFSEDPPTHAGFRCQAEIIRTGFTEYSDIINHLIDLHSTREYYPTPLSMLDNGDLVLVKLSVTDHKYLSYLRSSSPINEEE